MEVIQTVIAATRLIRDENVLAQGQMSPHHEYFYLETSKSEKHFFTGLNITKSFQSTETQTQS